MASDDPEFESKAADILGLYLNPPQHAVVFAADEKTAIQALDRLDPVLPLSPTLARAHQSWTQTLKGMGATDKEVQRLLAKSIQEPLNPLLSSAKDFIEDVKIKQLE